jgi:2-keto-4-pentenoate hydratase/2-oxohepta-3-ene-1,7-dioic acid hydratase in catechol pathway
VKLLRVGDPGAEVPAALRPDGGLVSLAGVVPDISGEVLAGQLTRIADHLADTEAHDLLPSAGLRLGAPVTRPGKVVCVGLNYRDHAAESGMDFPQEPVLFMKASQCVVGPRDDVRIPPGSLKTDWEIELAVVIGTESRYLADEQAAMDAVAGYCISHDVSEREYQLERGGQWDKGKSCDTFNPLGPWLVTRDEVADVQDIALETRVNGEVVQRGNTGDMIFGVAHLVRYISQFMVLEPGDVINTGTPAGVGMGKVPSRYLSAGDVVELDSPVLGSQRQTFVETPRS